MRRAALSAFLMASALIVAPAAAAAPDVTITRDSWGIAHISGKTDADAVFGMIYAQAEDDFNRIETNYLVNLGRLAEAEGEKAVWQDLRQRMFLDHDVLKADYAKSPPWLQKLMTAWASGLNHFLATHPDVHPRVIKHFEPWMALSFTEGSIGGDIENVPLSQLEAFYGNKALAMTANDRGLAYREPQGSNGLAIAPGRTRDGHALLLINPHTSFFFRSEAQVTSGEGLNAYGATTWGQFFVYQGFNAQAGWMHTSSGVDNIDEFAETVVDQPGGGKAYRYGAALRPVMEKVITLAVRQPGGKLAMRSFTTFATHHGPVTRKLADGRWNATALMNKPIAALEQSFLRTKTRDYASFVAVAARQANSSNNTLFADTKGEIAYLHPQFVPVRDKRFDYNAPVDGSDPATDWKGLFAMSALPRVTNPRTNWVFNVNDSPWWAASADSPKANAYPAYMDTAGENPRTPHAIRVLEANTKFTPEGLIAAAYDPYLTGFARLLPGLVAAYDRAHDPALADAITQLRGWDYRWSRESTATALAVYWGEALWGAIAAKAEAAKLSEWDYMATRATDAEKLAALASAVGKLKADFGSASVPWGEINRYQRNDGAITQIFDDSKPSAPVPFASAQWGSLASFGAKHYPGTKRMYGTSGNSFVAVVEFGPKLRAWAVTAGGESGDPASPHFADQVQRYADGALRPVWFYPEDVKAHAVKVYRP